MTPRSLGKEGVLEGGTLSGTSWRKDERRSSDDEIPALEQQLVEWLVTEAYNRRSYPAIKPPLCSPALLSQSIAWLPRCGEGTVQTCRIAAKSELQ